MSSEMDDGKTRDHRPALKCSPTRTTLPKARAVSFRNPPLKILSRTCTVHVIIPDVHCSVRRSAISNMESHKRNNNWLPPPWAIVAIGILGFNEFVMVLKNPFYIMAIFIVFLVSRALWIQLDVAREFQHGVIPGLISIFSRLLPTLMNILKKLAEEGNSQQSNPSPPPHHEPLRRPVLQRNTQSFKVESPRMTPRCNSLPAASSMASTISPDDSPRQGSPFSGGLLSNNDAASTTSS